MMPDVKANPGSYATARPLRLSLTSELIVTSLPGPRHSFDRVACAPGSPLRRGRGGVEGRSNG
jgi:hypothetical protein